MQAAQTLPGFDAKERECVPGEGMSERNGLD